MVFGYGSGEETKQAWPDVGLQFDSTIRASKGGRATIYALDAQTGKEIWSSGDQMHQWNHFSGITVVNGRVYLGTYDGTLYLSGFRVERGLTPIDGPTRGHQQTGWSLNTRKQWGLTPAVLLGGLLTAATPGPRPPDLPFRIQMIDGGASETAAVADINHDGRLDILSGENWYEAPAWTKHRFRDLDFTQQVHRRLQ